MAPKNSGQKSRTGKNSGLEEHKDEIRKIFKAQLALDRDKESQQAEWRERHSKLTARLKAIGGSRKASAEPYAAFKRTQNADTPDEERAAKEDNVVDLAFQKLAYEAVAEVIAPSGELEWNKLFAEADKINARRAEESTAAEEEEGDGGERAAGDDSADVREPAGPVH